MSKNTNIQLIQYKTIHRTHITQYKLFKMGFTNSSICTQCITNKTDDYFHAFWICTPVHRFWEKIEVEPSVKDTVPLLIALTIAKKTILLNWKEKIKKIFLKHF